MDSRSRLGTRHQGGTSGGNDRDGGVTVHASKPAVGSTIPNAQSTQNVSSDREKAAAHLSKRKSNQKVELFRCMEGSLFGTVTIEGRSQSAHRWSGSNRTLNIRIAS